MRLRRRCDHVWTVLGYGFMGHADLYCFRCHKRRVTMRHNDGSECAT